MRRGEDLPDLLERTRELDGEELEYRFANGLVIRAEAFDKDDPWRILPLGSPQSALMNHLVAYPERVRGLRVFEPFAGSGALGLMAAKVGAARVDLLDVNPRAAEFQRRNALLSGIPSDRIRIFTEDVARFVPERAYDVIVANPPFVPTPDGIRGTITSNGGPDGSRLIAILVERLDELLAPDGRALIYAFQLESGGQPAIAHLLRGRLASRPVELTRAQDHPIPLETFARAYRQLFPGHGAAIERWQAEQLHRHGSGATLSHYVIDVGPRSATAAGCAVRDDFARRFGRSFLAPSDDAAQLALGRVFENVTR